MVARSYLEPGRSLNLLRSGRDWGLFSLDSEVGRVEPGTNKLVFDPVRVAHLIAAGGPDPSNSTPQAENRCFLLYDQTDSTLLPDFNKPHILNGEVELCNR